MEPPAGSPDWLEVFTATERPDLWALAREGQVFYELWSEYNQHGNETPLYFGSLVPQRADFQALFLDRRTERIVARGRAIPFRWDGTLEDLPPGIDAAGTRAVTEPSQPTALCALAAEVVREYQSAGLSRLVLLTMVALARAHRLSCLVAPVRPNRKHQYPLTPIGRYATWRRPDGLPFDPWIRVHVRLGGQILRPEPRSLRIFAPIADWESWTGMAFPEDGQYIFPQGLATLEVSAGQGEYWEPNVWVLHQPVDDPVWAGGEVDRVGDTPHSSARVRHVPGLLLKRPPPSRCCATPRRSQTQRRGLWLSRGRPVGADMLGSHMSSSAKQRSDHPRCKGERTI